MIHDTVANETESREKTRRYAELGALKLHERGKGGILPALTHSAWTLIRGLVLKGGCLDGVIGWKIARANARGTFLRYQLAERLRSRTK